MSVMLTPPQLLAPLMMIQLPLLPLLQLLALALTLPGSLWLPMVCQWIIAVKRRTTIAAQRLPSTLGALQSVVSPLPQLQLSRWIRKHHRPLMTLLLCLRRRMRSRCIRVCYCVVYDVSVSTSLPEQLMIFCATVYRDKWEVLVAMV